MRNRTIGRLASGLLFCLLIGLTVAVVNPLQKEMTKRLELMKNHLVTAAGNDFGCSISYRSISPSLFHSLRINGLVIRNSSGRTIVSADTIRIYYRFFRLFSASPLDSLTEISLDSARLSLDTEDDRALITRLLSGDGTGATASPRGTLPRNIRITARNFSLALATPAGRAEIGGARINARLSGERLSATGGGSLSFRLAGGAGSLSRGTARFAVSAEADLDGTGAHGVLKLSDVATDVIGIRRLNLQVLYRSGVVEVAKVQDRLPLDLSVRYDGQTRVLSGSLECDRFSADSLVSLGGALVPDRRFLRTVLSGKLEAVFNTATGGLSYDCALSAVVPVEDGKQIHAVIDAAGSLHEVKVARIEVDSPMGTASFSGDIDLDRFLPRGQLSLKNLSLLDGRVVISGDCTLDHDVDYATLYAESVTISGVELRNLDAALYPRKGSFDFSVRAVYPRDASGTSPREAASYTGEAVAEAGFFPVVKVDGSFAFAGKPFLEGVVSLEYLTLADIYGMAKPFLGSGNQPAVPVSGLGNYMINAEIFVSTDFTHVAYNAPRFVIADSTRDGNYGIFSVVGNERQVALQPFSVFWNDQKLDGSVTVDFSRFDDITLAASFGYRGLNYDLDGLLLNGRDLAIKGSYGLSASASITESGTSFRIQADSVPLPLASATPTLSLDVRGMYRTPADWTVIMESLSLAHLGTVLNSTPTIALSGSLSPSGGTFPVIVLSDQYSRLEGTAHADWRLAAPFGLKLDLSLASREGTERYHAQAGIENGVLKGSLAFTDFPVIRCAQLPVTGGISGTADLDGRIGSPVVSFSVETHNMVYEKNSVLAKATGRIDTDRLELSGISVRYVNDRMDGGQARVDFATGAAAASGSIATNFIGNPVRFSFSAGARLPGLSRGDMSTFDARLGITNLFMKNSPYRDWNLVFRKADGILSVTEPDTDAVSAEIRDSGDFSVRGSGAFPFNGTVRGRVAGNMINLDIDAERLDFAFFWPLLNVGVVKFDSAVARGHVTIRGPVGDPGLYGTLQAENVVLEVPEYVSEKIGPISTPLVFDEKLFTIGPVPFQTSPSMATGMFTGRFVFERWVPDTYLLHVTVDPDKPARLATTISGITVDGSGSTDLVIDGNPQRILINGTVDVADSSVMLNAKALAAASTETPVPPGVEVVPLVAQVRVNIGRKVEFVWPSKEFPVVRGTANRGNQLQLQYDGQSGSFSIKGVVTIRGGTVYYVERSFYLKEGRIVFNEDENRFDPLVSLRAEIRERNDSGPVTITLIADNNRMSNFSPRFTSDPSLSNLAILNLLGGSIFGEQSSGSTASLSSALLATSDIPAQFYVVRVIEQEVRNALKLDLFSLRTQFLQNFVIDAAGIQRSPLDTGYSLGKYFDNSTVYLGKYLGNDLFFQSMLQLQMLQSVPGSGVYDKPDFTAELGLEFKTPYFTLGWQFLPDHPETLFITDNSFTFSWKYSF